jgi:hypothetical protein
LPPWWGEKNCGYTPPSLLNKKTHRHPQALTSLIEKKKQIYPLGACCLTSLVVENLYSYYVNHPILPWSISQSLICSFFCGKILPLGDRKELQFSKDFLGEKPPNSSHFGGTKVELPYLDYRLLHVVKYIVPGFQKILIFLYPVAKSG